MVTAWWRSLRPDEKLGAIGWALFLLFVACGVWIGR